MPDIVFFLSSEERIEVRGIICVNQNNQFVLGIYLCLSAVKKKQIALSALIARYRCGLLLSLERRLELGENETWICDEFLLYIYKNDLGASIIKRS